jgi:hypothetical protein
MEKEELDKLKASYSFSKGGLLSEPNCDIKEYKHLVLTVGLGYKYDMLKQEYINKNNRVDKDVVMKPSFLLSKLKDNK